MADQTTFKIYRGGNEAGEMVDYSIPVAPGMVVLDAVHAIQATQAPDLACRWNCKAGKCGSCSAEVNGKPRLMCMDRLDQYPGDAPVAVRPMKAFPVIKDLVCDVSWNYEVNKKIPAFKPSPTRERRFSQEEADRVQEFRKCIECFLCQNVCHVLREHNKHDEFGGPRLFVRAAALEMHPLDEEDRLGLLKDELGLGYCNITKCCTEVCPEGITITDNAIIPLKERVVDEFYDPIKKLFRILSPKK
ncbi:succinate dehydrogenase/fumarate reductase iron-sulfur subunit [Pirellulales bacterium]|nr:succinate dehydrogenase/fumarate reductase iron-sulfur subunit [Pirellulales bacterium]